jgi:DNA invertase Pin-like site-specific DNA recombinase
MKDFESTMTEGKKAVIYCRVSSKKQTVDGSGLDSQEHRCRQYAAARGYEVEGVFSDDVTGGGDFMKRPGIVALLGYLDDRPLESYVVIFDDLKRYARDTEFHLRLRREMAARNATRECLNFNFEDSPEGEFHETIAAAASTLERKQNARQVRQKMQARVEAGYWCFRAPVGYKYVQGKHGGKELVPDESLAPIVKEALEGYACGRFASQTDLKRFLESQPLYPKDKPNGEIRWQTIVRLLGKEVYAGLVCAKKWGVSLRPGKHEALISIETLERIRRRQDQGVYAPTRSGIHSDFVLRGAVACSKCGNPITAAWSKGKYNKFAYYRCRKKGCAEYGKSIPRAKIEGEFRALLETVQPSRNAVRIAVAMFRDYWAGQTQRAAETLQALKGEAAKIETQIGELVDRIVEVTNPRAVAAFEKRIEELERRQLVLRERASKSGATRHSFEQLFELSLRFLANPCVLWDSGRFELRRMVLSLVFSEHLPYCRAEGWLNSKTTLPFSVLRSFDGRGSKMVPPGRIELPTSPLPR